jgi:Flp pilus assembly protein TadD
MAANAVQAAPAGLAGTVAAAAVQGAAAGGSTLTLIQGALKIMAWTKMKTAVATGIVVILAAGTTTVLMEKTGDATPLITQGWQLLQAGQRQEALGMFDRAVKIDPQNPAAWNGLGWALFNSGRSAEAEPDFQKVLTLNPDFPAALNGLGQLNLSRKRYAEAEAFLLKAAPQAPAAWFGLARLYLLQGQFAAAETWAQQIVESGQGDDTARQMLQAAKDKKLSPALRLIIEPQ